ncbi:MAG: cell wall hydrolase [Erysipelotrichaceae bacterium]|nr:cell wall hydrolase [Erysipelotrichaceae bacterium]
MPRIAYNDADVELLARIMKAEALGEGDEGMLMVGNVVVNRVVAECDVFRNTRTISEVIYQTNAFAGVGQPLFNEAVNAKERELALRNIEGYRVEPAYNALWFKNPGSNVTCPETFYGELTGRYKNHCFYAPGAKLNCDL